MRYLLPRKEDNFYGGWEERDTIVVELKQEGVNWADKGFQYTYEDRVGGGGTKRNKKTGGYEAEIRQVVKRGLYSNIVSIFDPETDEELKPEQIQPTCIYERRDKHSLFTILRAPQWIANEKDGVREARLEKEAKREARREEENRLRIIEHQQKHPGMMPGNHIKRAE